MAQDVTTRAFDRCERADADVKSGPHAWIQWKGTRVCMDFWCACGKSSHVDDDFTYYVRCPHCGQIYAMCANVRAIPLTQAEFDAEGTRCLSVAEP